MPSHKENFLITKTETAADLPLPAYMTAHAAGMDLYACVETEQTLMPGDIRLVPTGIKIALPEGFEAQIRPRSGLAHKHGIMLPNAPGTIDADYRGEIQVILLNAGKEPFVIRRGDRIAQMVVARVERVAFTLTERIEEDTARGSGGFGHTGV